MNYWLFKTEPDAFSIDDLKKQGSTLWDGVRNYQARNIMRDQIALGDHVFIYHSSCKQPAIVGIAKVTQINVDDPTQFDAASPYYDPKATPEEPRWQCVELSYVKHVIPIPLQKIKQDPRLNEMHLVKKGSRLSVQPIKICEWEMLQLYNNYS